MTTTHVSGETVDDLARAILAIDGQQNDDGSWRFEGSFESEIALPLRRALMRTEADLMTEAADALPAHEVEWTPEQRQYDAFMELVRRFAEAVAT